MSSRRGSSVADGDRAEKMEDPDLSVIQNPEEPGDSRQQNVADPNPNPEEVLELLRDLNDPAVLLSLFSERRWLDADKYLAKGLFMHHKKAGAPTRGADAPGDMLRMHPELFVQLRRLHVLELLGERKYQEARQYYNNTIIEPTRDVRRTRHLDTLLSELDDMIVAVEALPSILNLPVERRVGCKHVQDYLQVYYPELNKGRAVRESIAASSKLLYSTTSFAEVTGLHKFRCLVCHAVLTFEVDPNNHMVEHLHDHCPAVTPAVRRRLPNRNRRPKRPRADDDPKGTPHVVPED